MELAQIFRTLWTRKLAVAGVIACALAVAVLVHQSSKKLPTGSATTQILVDSPMSAIANLKQDTAPLVTRATIFAQFMTSGTIRQEISRATGIPAAQITAEGPFSGPGEAQNVVTPSEARSNQVTAEKAPYRLTYVAQENLPVVSVYAQADTPAGAAKLANGAYQGVQAYLQRLESEYQTAPEQRVTIRQLGTAEPAAVNGGSGKALMLLAFTAVVLLGCLAILAVAGLLQRARAEEEPAPESGPIADGLVGMPFQPEALNLPTLHVPRVPPPAPAEAMPSDDAAAPERAGVSVAPSGDFVVVERSS